MTNMMPPTYSDRPQRDVLAAVDGDVFVRMLLSEFLERVRPPYATSWVEMAATLMSSPPDAAVCALLAADLVADGGFVEPVMVDPVTWTLGNGCHRVTTLMDCRWPTVDVMFSYRNVDVEVPVEVTFELMVADVDELTSVHDLWFGADPELFDKVSSLVRSFPLRPRKWVEDLGMSYSRGEVSSVFMVPSRHDVGVLVGVLTRLLESAGGEVCVGEVRLLDDEFEVVEVVRTFLPSPV